MNKLKNQLKQLDAAQLSVEVEKLRRELFSLRLAVITSPAKDYKQPRRMRKNIARGLTYLQQKAVQK
jgi:ribosomal protein L29